MTIDIDAARKAPDPHFEPHPHVSENVTFA